MISRAPPQYRLKPKKAIEDLLRQCLNRAEPASSIARLVHTRAFGCTLRAEPRRQWSEPETGAPQVQAVGLFEAFR